MSGCQASPNVDLGVEAQGFRFEIELDAGAAALRGEGDPARFFSISRVDLNRQAERQRRLYLEWFSQNGQVVVELVDPIIEFVAPDEPDAPLEFDEPPAECGVPADADFVFDARCLPNPHYDLRLRPLTGLDEEVSGFVRDSPGTREYLERLYALLDFLFPRYAAEGKAHLTIGVGCTGGRHRSVAIAQLIGERYQRQGYYTVVRHRDLTRD